MRLVSLCPSLTELVFDLGAGDELVGLTRWCVHPADRVRAVEKVGGSKDPDVARIVELAPDLDRGPRALRRDRGAALLRRAGRRPGRRGRVADERLAIDHVQKFRSTILPCP